MTTESEALSPAPEAPAPEAPAPLTLQEALEEALEEATAAPEAVPPKRAIRSAVFHTATQSQTLSKSHKDVTIK